MSVPAARFLESVFDHCDEKCGWTAAFVAALAYGTFGVPVKETRSVDVHPLVLQSYKTCTMFLFAWGIICMGQDIKWTPWGLLSGFLWVAGGTGGIFAIRAAGMAIAVGTWSSVMILVNFCVGIIAFREPVASFWSTCGAFLCLACGLVGMSIFSAPTKPTSALQSNRDSSLLTNHTSEEIDEDEDVFFNNSDNQQPLEHELSSMTAVAVTDVPLRRQRSAANEEMENVVDNYDLLRDPSSAEGLVENFEVTDTASGLGTRITRRNSRTKKEEQQRKHTWEHRFGLSQRELGILGAVMNGILTGFSLVPIHYAKKQGFGGAAYMLSFSSGALCANITIWAIWFFVKLFLAWREQMTLAAPATASATEVATVEDSNGVNSFLHLARQTYESMPLCHFKQLYIPGFSAGLLLSIAMFGSILSVTYLGQGVGNSIIQSKILISGLWGIFYYKEIAGGAKIAKWFGSAGLTISGIIWLSYQRIHAKQ